jgi:hypothetical protein
VSRVSVIRGGALRAARISTEESCAGSEWPDLKVHRHRPVPTGRDEADGCPASHQFRPTLASNRASGPSAEECSTRPRRTRSPRCRCIGSYLRRGIRRGSGSPSSAMDGGLSARGNPCGRRSARGNTHGRRSARSRPKRRPGHRSRPSRDKAPPHKVRGRRRSP